MALLEYPDSTLLGVNRMLSDKHYRKKVVENIKDPAVKSFWVDEFANYNERYMQEAGDAIKNKIGQFTANPLIRNIIGQPKSSFDLRKIMDEKKIIIMNLSKGLVGESNANLLGSMLTTRIYLAAMSRADMSPAALKEMPNFYFYVDEFQSFANATFADILSEARKYKLNLTIAHQYIEQMEEEVKNAVFGNVGTIISFRVGPFDAEILETIYTPQFLAPDIVNLGFAQIYLTLMIDGIGSRPFSAVTLPPITPPSVSCKDMVIAESRRQFAFPREEVEAHINAWHDEDHTPPRPPRSPHTDAAKQANHNQKNNAKPFQNRDRARVNDGRRSEGQQTSSRSAIKSSAEKKVTSAPDLRDTLSKLAKQQAVSSSKNTHEDKNNHALKHPRTELRDALKGVIPQKKSEGATPAPVKPPKSVNTNTAQPSTPREVDVQTANDVDPKVIERMLKLRSDDKPPLR